MEGCQGVSRAPEKPEHEWHAHEAEHGREKDDRRRELGMAAIFFGQHEVDDRRWQRAIEDDHLPVDTLHADERREENRRGEAAADADYRAGERMADGERLYRVEPVAQAH